MIGWIKYFFILLLSGAFLVFGIQLLIAAYKLNDPFLFIVSFFSSNLIILISATLFFGFIYRMIWCRKKEPDDEEI